MGWFRPGRRREWARLRHKLAERRAIRLPWCFSSPRKRQPYATFMGYTFVQLSMKELFLHPFRPAVLAVIFSCFAVAQTSTINTFAGSQASSCAGGACGDGFGATSAQLNAPGGVAVDAAGNV